MILLSHKTVRAINFLETVKSIAVQRDRCTEWGCELFIRTGAVLCCGADELGMASTKIT
jgi:hypothetical protein